MPREPREYSTINTSSGEVSGDDILREALAALSRREEIARAERTIREVSTAFRWNEALRRRWREARAEASIRCAVASGRLEGARCEPDELRAMVMSGEIVTSGDQPVTHHAREAVAGLWRAHARIETLLPDLVGCSRPVRPAAPELLAGLNRDVATPLAHAGALSSDEIGRPRTRLPCAEGPGKAPVGEELAERVRLIGRLIDAPQLPALVRIACVHGEMLSARPFLVGNAAVGRLLGRYLSVIEGLEPTGVAVADSYAAMFPHLYRAAASGYASGSIEGVSAWVTWHAESIIEGLGIAHDIARRIQAGRAS